MGFNLDSHLPLFRQILLFTSILIIIIMVVKNAQTACYFTSTVSLVGLSSFSSSSFVKLFADGSEPRFS